MTAMNQYEKKLEITAHSEWSQRFWDELLPAKERVSKHRLFLDMASGSLSLECFRSALLNFYPLVAHFPSYMAGTLAKATAFSLSGVTETRDWLIQNIKVEERHLTWYQDWAGGFGLTIDMLNNVRPPAAMNAVNHFLWDVNYRGSLAESIAATNLAIEWATGDWSIQVYKGVQSYTQNPEVTINKRSLAWLRAHAHYDDLHPYEAMELIKRLCDQDPVMQKKAFLAAQEGLAYYELALDECYKIQQANR
ncbi:iron-containing redox enzyme family protein [Acinetobacter haemolyticus]|uniref:TenA family transcriptional regulator n=1 Tax=Acinetobacter haemolyticus TaxID=29430 RepID=UPI000F687B92|nr:iron-containing redox enzyme family protein [Acinetobacter haemolyticus]NAR85236.1 iron-containing redox enzyme family protein [Acinetobacter haemolyticus]NAR95334.1 iron-containing redox enzyme family protein [Acinetobacter haemolyticus]NAS06817.1 iron-containing redox enzyme family protein [Acinetobacter haemolyticus]QHI16662.1 iron-containing redox enzyme family protein [Acinetobacter haemolyticus]RSC80148.1 iron-containing redox enzyme family protein [Acinetobacter haemolyticus]